MEEIKGYVEHIVYRNEDNGYTVFNLNNDDGDLTCVGKFHYIDVSRKIRCRLNVILVPELSKVSDRRWQDGS